jgi:hypothetical protein
MHIPNFNYSYALIGSRFLIAKFFKHTHQVKCWYMRNLGVGLFGFLFLGQFILAQKSQTINTQFRSPLSFVKTKIASESYESVGVFDVNNDNVQDIISGAYWYVGPDFNERHYIGSAKRYGEYYDDFSTIPLDVNGDGNIDFITGGWFGKELIWKENPGDNSKWKQHLIATPGNIESTRSWDIDGDGIKEIVPNTPNDPLIVYRLMLDVNGKGTGKFQKHTITEKNGHGLGFGDINGDGMGDLIISNGWVEAPKNPFEEDWKFHQEFELGTGSVPIIVADVDHDGLNDLIVGQGHDYGLDWYRQEIGTASGWTKHPIDSFNSQYHSMEWEDMDNDGHKELITGKRYRAHNGKDPGGNDPTGLYYFKWTGSAFSKQVIDYGPYGKGKGTGVFFTVIDINASGKKDIIVAGKDGLYIYYNN